MEFCTYFILIAVLFYIRVIKILTDYLLHYYQEILLLSYTEVNSSFLVFLEYRFYIFLEYFSHFNTS